MRQRRIRTHTYIYTIENRGTISFSAGGVRKGTTPYSVLSFCGCLEDWKIVCLVCRYVRLVFSFSQESSRFYIELSSLYRYFFTHLNLIHCFNLSSDWLCDHFFYLQVEWDFYRSVRQIEVRGKNYMTKCWKEMRIFLEVCFFTLFTPIRLQIGSTISEFNGFVASVEIYLK